MNVGFFIALLRTNKINGYHFQQDVFNWQGVDYPQPPSYVQLQTIKAIEVPMASVLGWRHKTFPLNDWMGLEITSSSFKNYYYSLQCEEPEWSEDKQNAEKFINLFESDIQLILNATSKWFLVFIPQYEHINEFHIETAPQTISRLRQELKRNDWMNRGFISAAPGSGVHFDI